MTDAHPTFALPPKRPRSGPGTWKRHYCDPSVSPKHAKGQPSPRTSPERAPRSHELELSVAQEIAALLSPYPRHHEPSHVVADVLLRLLPMPDCARSTIALVVHRNGTGACDVALIPLRVGGFNWWASEETLELLDGVDRARAELPVPRRPLRRVFVLNEALERTRLGQCALMALEQLGEEAPGPIPQRVHYAAAATAGESVFTYTDRQLPPGVPVREQPAAIEMWKLWRALAEPALGGNTHV